MIFVNKANPKQNSDTIAMLGCLADDVEFEVSSDRRTGKPIAIKLVKIKPEILPEERINGQVSAYFLYLHHFHPLLQYRKLGSFNMDINYLQYRYTEIYFSVLW